VNVVHEVAFILLLISVGSISKARSTALRMEHGATKSITARMSVLIVWNMDLRAFTVPQFTNFLL
jgi:hypothetical protein